MEESSVKPNFISLTAQIVSAYVSHNSISTTDLPKILAETYAALRDIDQAPKTAEAVEELKPAVSIRKSVQQDYIVCLEDGKKFKSLKRHLRTHFNMTPEEYRERWSLPDDYPMVAPSYSATRSRLAKDNGLGRKAA